MGQAVLEEIIRTTRCCGYTELFLEIGNIPLCEPVQAQYLRSGLTLCQPFGDYIATKLNVCVKDHPSTSEVTL